MSLYDEFLGCLDALRHFDESTLVEIDEGYGDIIEFIQSEHEQRIPIGIGEVIQGGHHNSASGDEGGSPWLSGHRRWANLPGRAR